MNEIEYRTYTPDEELSFMEAISRGFGNASIDPEETDDFREVMGDIDSVGAFDGAKVVGTSGAAEFTTNVPGGKLQTAGVTIVTVQPTHRRRGILTQMMGRLLERRREKGDVVASLLASETPIYGRFGYGLAVQRDRFKILRGRAALRDDGEIEGKVRLVELEKAREIVPNLAERAGAERPGWIARPKLMWDHRMRDAEYRRHGNGQLNCAVYEDGGKAQGFVLYRRTGDDRDRVNVVELQAVNATANEALWQFVFGIDLVDEIEAGTRPVDDPLPWMLADMRGLQVLRQDWIWSRLLDVERALSERTYGDEASLVIRVVDDFGVWCDGTFRLEAGVDGATCKSTNESADLTMSVAELSSIYFGGVKASALARAGRIEATSGEALRTADSVFATKYAPWDVVDF